MGMVLSLDQAGASLIMFKIGSWQKDVMVGLDLGLCLRFIELDL